jgi:hypothetical protein
MADRDKRVDAAGQSRGEVGRHGGHGGFSARLSEANTKERKFEDVVKSAEQAAVLVLVY